jgi:hypothetical protein
MHQDHPDAGFGGEEVHAGQRPVKSKLALASLILAVGSVFLGPLLGVPALILGIAAIKEIRRSGGLTRGCGFAIAGIITSATWLLLIGLAVVAVPLSLVGGLKLRPVNPRGVLKAGRLADLPASATDVRCEGWSGLFTGTDYVMFRASAEDIEKFITQSPSAKGAVPDLLNAEHRRLPYREEDYAEGHEESEDDYERDYFAPESLAPKWYDVTMKGKGRRYEIPGDPDNKGYNFGSVIINDQTNTVYIRVVWS